MRDNHKVIKTTSPSPLNKDKNKPFEQDVQELAAALLFPILVFIALIIHFTLSLYHFPAPKTTSFNSHLQAFIPTIFLPFYLLSPRGPLTRFVKIQKLRSIMTLSLLGLYAIGWVVFIRDKSISVKKLGVIMGTVIGMWFGFIATSTSEIIEMTEKNNLPPNRKARRQKEREDAKKSSSKH